MTQELLKSVVSDTLTYTPNKPFLCLPISALLYATLKDRHNVEAKLVTGNLAYKDEYIFKQDFSISEAENNVFQTWSGHAWVEADGLILDLSFFRTLYSDSFTKPCKNELIQAFGEGRGSLITSAAQMNEFGFTYEAMDYLEDEMATGIINGFKELL